MKALILAAGLGTRLLPHTKHTPKPLFPIDGRPLLDHVIRSLIKADCRGIVVNTHHLHGQIEAFLKGQRYPVPVTTRYEPDILGTGGAMKNLADFFSGKPFMVINSDIVTDIHLKDVYVFHCRHQDAATLVLHDCPTFNSVSLNSHGCITGFGVRSLHAEHASGTLAFTGIQVLDPSILAHIPAGCFYSSIDLYRQLIQRGEKVRAYFAENHHWRDIGTPEQYREAVYRETVPDAFRAAFPGLAVDDIHRQKLMGDGSDRLWFRLTSGDKTLVMADHGIRENRSTAEVDSFVDIGRFLFEKKLPVPEIHLYHRFSGLVFLEDLGDVHLQAYLKGVHHPEGVISVYETIIEQLAAMWTSGSEGFNPSWTYQSPRYDRGLILERECHYFLRAFINNYMEIPFDVEVLNPEFNTLADGVLAFSFPGFMHRDMQSRNIMVKGDRFYFIDFQGGRLGPVQYDLASLLIDPYVDLPREIQTPLIDVCMDKLASVRNLDRHGFLEGFRYCTIARNLQILGAFGFLSREKGKTSFKKYILPAVKGLKHHLSFFPPKHFPHLSSLVKKAHATLINQKKRYGGNL